MSDALEFKRKFVISFCLFVGVLVTGTLGFWLVGGGQYSLFDCMYMTVITVSTVGYGEVIDFTGNPGGRVFAMAMIFIGMGIIVYFVSTATAFFVEGDLKEIFWRNRMKKKIAAMQGHYIVCGAGTMGSHVVDEFHRTGRSVVAVDMDEQKIEALRERYDGIGLITGDAAENEVLADAGVGHAQGVVVATTSDKDNLVITLSARQMNATTRIVTRCSDVKHIKKLKRAGADTVVSSNFIGGLRLASEMVRPKVTTFLDHMLRDHEKALRIEEVPVPHGSSLAGRTLKEFRSHILVLAVYGREGEQYTFNPPDTYVVNAGETVIFMGSPDDRERLMQSAGIV
jgi:voltage-gated potassium channel